MAISATTYAPAAVKASDTFFRPQQPKEPKQHNQQQNHLNSSSSSQHQQQQQQLFQQEQTQHQDFQNDHQLFQDLFDITPITGATTSVEQPSFLDDCTSSLWTGDNFGDHQADFDWTALGLDCLGTQLLQPGSFDLGAELQPTISLDSTLDQQSHSVDMLFGADDLGVSMEEAHAAIETGEQLFSNSLLPSPGPNQTYHSSTTTSTPALQPLNHHQGSASPSHSPSSSEHSSSSKGTKRVLAASDDTGEDDASAKRQRNTMAARRYRQRRVDRLADLEKQLKEITSERDDLRVKLARREAEVGALRDVLSAKK